MSIAHFVFQVGALVNKAIMNNLSACMQTFVNGKYIKLHMKMIKWFPKWFYHFAFTSVAYESFHSSTCLPTFNIVNYLNFSHSIGCTVVLHCGLMCISLKTNNIKHTFHEFILHLSTFFSEPSAQILRPFLIVLSGFLQWREFFI